MTPEENYAWHKKSTSPCRRRASRSQSQTLLREQNNSHR
jgi:hypothetical protein